jgi:hypothetical protein
VITKNRIAIIGSATSGGALQIIDAISGSNEQIVVALFDSDASLKGKKVLGVEVLDNSNNILPYFNQGLFDSAIIGVGGNLDERERIYHQLINSDIPLANIVDKTTQVRTGVKMGLGNVILGNAYIGPNVVIGNNCYILNNISVQHDSVIGDHCYLATGVIIGAHVNVGNKVRFEIGSGVKSRIKVKDEIVIPAGSILSN